MVWGGVEEEEYFCCGVNYERDVWLLLQTGRRKPQKEDGIILFFFLLRLARIFTIFFLRTRTTTPATALFPDGFFLSSGGGGGGSGSDGGGGRGRTRARDEEESQKQHLPNLYYLSLLFLLIRILYIFVYILAYTYYFTLHYLSDCLSV